MHTSDCTFICEQFTEYHENTLSSNIRAQIDTHLASCSACSKLFTELAAAIQTLHDLPGVKTSTNFTSTLLSKIETQKHLRPWQRFYQSTYPRIAGYAVAAGLLVAIGINLLLDPINMQQNGGKIEYAAEKAPQSNTAESLAGLGDSSMNAHTDSLELNNPTISNQGQALQLVSGKK